MKSINHVVNGMLEMIHKVFKPDTTQPDDDNPSSNIKHRINEMETYMKNIMRMSDELKDLGEENAGMIDRVKRSEAIRKTIDTLHKNLQALQSECDKVGSISVKLTDSRSNDADIDLLAREIVSDTERIKSTISSMIIASDI